MTIKDAIERIDSLMHNTYNNSEKVAWLSRLDYIVKKTIIDKHVGEVEFNGYNDNTPLDTELLVPEPYAEIYLRFLEAQMAYHNGEYLQYNNAIEMYNTALADYAAYYTSTHKPKASGRFLF